MSQWGDHLLIDECILAPWVECPTFMPAQPGDIVRGVCLISAPTPERGKQALDACSAKFLNKTYSYWCTESRPAARTYRVN